MTLGALAAVLLLGTSMSPYAREVPGPVLPITISGSEHDMGRYAYTTVELDQLRWWDYLLRRAQGDESAERVIVTDVDVTSLGEMEKAKSTAWDVGASLAGADGCDVVRIEEFTSEAPARKAGLEVGDEILTIDGEAMHCTAEVVTAVRNSRGDLLRFEVRRDGATLTVNVTPEFLEGHWRIGVTGWASNEPRHGIDTAHVGGASAGLLMTLAYVDSFGDGDLTGGRLVSGTGTIALDGTVGPIGGVALKLQAAERAGADVFFVPAEQAAGVTSTRLTVVPVSDVVEALRWLCENGSTQQNGCPTN